MGISIDFAGLVSGFYDFFDSLNFFIAQINYVSFHFFPLFKRKSKMVNFKSNIQKNTGVSLEAIRLPAIQAIL